MSIKTVTCNVFAGVVEKTRIVSTEWNCGCERALDCTATHCDQCFLSADQMREYVGDQLWTDEIVVTGYDLETVDETIARLATACARKQHGIAILNWKLTDENVTNGVRQFEMTVSIPSERAHCIDFPICGVRETSDPDFNTVVLWESNA